MSEALANTSLSARVLNCPNAPAAWSIIHKTVVPQTDDELHLVRQYVEHVEYRGDEHPDKFFARLDGILHILSYAGEKKSEADVVRIIRRRLPDRLYGVEKRSTLTAAGLSRDDVEEIVRGAFARGQSAKLLGSASSAATPVVSAPGPAAIAASPSHALAFGTGGDFRREAGRAGGGTGKNDRSVQPPQPRPHLSQQPQQSWDYDGGGRYTEGGDWLPPPQWRQQQQQQWRRPPQWQQGEQQQRQAGPQGVQQQQWPNQQQQQHWPSRQQQQQQWPNQQQQQQWPNQQQQQQWRPPRQHVMVFNQDRYKETI